MDISFDMFLFFWMEKKLILLSHICNIKYIEPYQRLSSVLLNGDDVSAKKLLI